MPGATHDPQQRPQLPLFRLTWNAHRIHYDGDYARSEEGYPALVSNGGRRMQLMVDAALATATAPSPAAPPGSSIRCGSAT